MDAEFFYATGDTNTTAPSDENCRFEQDSDGADWLMSITVNDCGINAESNDSFIRYPLTILNELGL